MVVIYILFIKGILMNRNKLIKPHLSYRVAVLLVLMGTIFVISCGDDFGSPCSLPATQEVQEACGTKIDDSGVEISSSCVVMNMLECDNHVCAVYKGSSPFCTKECVTQGDCPSDATCKEDFVVGAGRSFCVKNTLLTP